MLPSPPLYTLLPLVIFIVGSMAAWAELVEVERSNLWLLLRFLLASSPPDISCWDSSNIKKLFFYFYLGVLPKLSLLSCVIRKFLLLSSIELSSSDCITLVKWRPTPSGTTSK